MKRLFLLMATVVLANIVLAQAPQQFNYQAIIHNSEGELVTDQTIGVKVTIYEENTPETPSYVETHTANTNVGGLLTIAVGTGNSENSFPDISWSQGSHYISVSIDLNGGSNYTMETNSQLMSVPYALYAASAPEEDGNIYNEIQDLSGVLHEDTDAGGLRITNLGNPVENQDASTKAYVDALSEDVEVALGIMTEVINNMTVQLNSMDDYIKTNLEVGDFYGGGVVFYIFEDGDEYYEDGEVHGMICAIENLPSSPWALNNILVGCNLQEIGDGYQNTHDILENCETGEGILAAEKCDNYEYGGFDDWFLPSEYSLEEMFNHQEIIHQVSIENGGTGFDYGYFWASTEYDNSRALLGGLIYNDFGGGEKNDVYRVRAVRRF